MDSRIRARPSQARKRITIGMATNLKKGASDTKKYYRWKDRKDFGKLGAASRCVRIDPKTGEVTEL